MTDRVLELHAQIETAMGKFDVAIAQRGGAVAASIHADRAQFLDEQFAATIPSTLAGAACKLQDVVVTMEAGEDPLAKQFTRQINPIIARLAGGSLRLDDIIRLRGLYSVALLYPETSESALACLDTTITGLSRPTVASSRVPA
jgi:hypothetical protein